MAATYLGLAILSAAALAFEITLTRLFSVTQWYHFAFLAVSVALLGYGASGTALTLVPRWSEPPAARRSAGLSVLFSASVLGAYLSLNHLPFDSYRIAWERIQVLYLVLYYLALAVPFFFAGMVAGLLLAAYPAQGNRLYAANLLGSTLGCLMPVLVLPGLGEGTVLAIAATGVLAALAFGLPSTRRDRPFRRSLDSRLSRRLLLLAACVVLLVLAWRLPAAFHLRLSPYKGLSQVLRFPDSKVVWQRWSAYSRVDLVESPAIRSAPGLSMSYPGSLPPEDGLFVDGDDLSPVLRGAAVGQDPAGLQEVTRYLPVALPYRLRPGGRALILEPRGGLDVWVALSQGAGWVVTVESNPLVVEAAGPVYRDARVTVRVEEGRSYARRSRETFDVVHLSLADGYRPVTSGAFGLGERYDLTVEAFQDYLARLRPGGLLLVERWIQLPPSEELRAGAAAVEALRRSGVQDPAAQLAVLRGWQLALILVKNGAFVPEEIEQIRGFAGEQGLDLVALPGLSEAETDHYNVIGEPVYFRAFRQLLTDPEGLYEASAYDVRPPTDDRPFFYHFFRWRQSGAVLSQLGKSWQPWGGSGTFVLVALLAIASAASAVLILFPLAIGRRAREPGARSGCRVRVLLYFGLLGLGFLLAEIPLMQRFILFLGKPVYGFTAVLAALLLGSGLGSLASTRLRAVYALPLLVAALLLYPFLLPPLFRALLGAPLAVRLGACGVALVPLGLLMGTAFPSGLAWLRENAPGWVPWAWAVNGCASVLASIVAALLALSTGFSWVLVLAALCYAGAWLVLRARRPRPGE